MDPAQVAAFGTQFHPPGYPVSAAAPTNVHPAPAANTAPSHPSYTEMITAAIQWENSQGKEGGSSKRAIAKYIDRVYTTLPPTHSALLTHHLKRLKSAGQLVMVKNSYQLPSLVNPTPLRSVPSPQQQHQQQPFHPPTQQQFFPPPAQQQFFPPPAQQQFFPPPAQESVVSPTPKRRPGRPPKQKQPEQAQFQAEMLNVPAPVAGSVAPSANGTGHAGSGKRPRGRPPRNQQQQVVVPFDQPASQVSEEQSGPVFVDPGMGVVNNGQASGLKKRGRPRKQQPAVPVQVPVSIAQETSSVFQVQMEPPQEVAQPVYQDMQVNGSVVMEEFERRRPARGGSVGVGRGGGRGRGRPRKDEVLGVAPASQVVGKKPRGWPKGKPRAKKGTGAGAAPVPAGSVAGEITPKRRGRRPKGSVPVVVQKERKLYTGKPRGRPKKNAPALRKHPFLQGQEMADEELLRKLQDMQFQIRDAVGAIRPLLTNQNTDNALVNALRQLEDLSTMDLTASQTEPEPTVMTMPVHVTAPSENIFAPESEEEAAAPDLSAPPMMTAPEPPAVTVTLPFTLNMPTMATTEPMLASSEIESQPPFNWFPSSDAQ